MTSKKFSDGGLSRTDASGETNDKHRWTVASRFNRRTHPPDRDRRRAANTTDNLVALATAVRWGTTVVGLLWAAALRSRGQDLALGVVLLAYAMWRTFMPVRYRRRGWKSLLSILSELGVSVAVVVATGCWDSPYIFVLFTPVIAAGFARGFWHALRIGTTAAIAVGMAAFLLGLDSGIRPATDWCGELFLVAAVASYGSRLLTRAEEAGVLTLTQEWRLNEANSLLVSLNRLAHEMPVSFDFHETISSAISQIREATHPDVIALLLLEPLSSVWSVVAAEGARLPESYMERRLPAGALAAARGTRDISIEDLGPNNPGFNQSSRSGIYVPLRAGDRHIGLLAVESADRDKFAPLHTDLLLQLAETVGLTIDNARWFDRLRARGAAQERTRIARDLHDRVGQGVAYVAFELDRLSKRAHGTEMSEDIDQLRADARSIVSELRETLYDLRADVSDERSFETVVSEFLGRVASRSKLKVSFDRNELRRIPLSQEREVWRICQEAIVNVERHANARKIEVVWDTDHDGALLTITDDGVGVDDDKKSGRFAISESSERPSYGLTGMRERAESIGGVLEVTPGTSGGTTVRLTLGTLRREHEARNK